MIRFSANLGFLWTDRALPDAIRAAKVAGFHAVECHWPYDIPADKVADALSETGFKMLGLNTRRGHVAGGENGVAALTGREDDARRYVDEAITYAAAIGCGNIHVMAGFTDKGSAAKAVFADNLTYACRQAARHGKTILIEPLNRYDAPGYHLSTLEEAADVLQAVGEPNLKIMFDCYHLQIMGGNLFRRFQDYAAAIGHIQFAAVPDRSEPDSGEVDYPWLLNAISDAGYRGFFGAEYKPRATTDEGISWLSDWTG